MLQPIIKIPESFIHRTTTEPSVSPSLARKIEPIWVAYVPSEKKILVNFEDEKATDLPIFSFAPLNDIRKDLEKIGYSTEEIDSTIEGLSELPEYENSK